MGQKECWEPERKRQVGDDGLWYFLGLKALALLCFAFATLPLPHFVCCTRKSIWTLFVCEVWGDRRREGKRIFGREEDGDGSNRRRNDALPLRLWFFSHSLYTSCLACCSIFFSTSLFVVLTLWRRI